jgi:hypothetical protein
MALLPIYSSNIVNFCIYGAIAGFIVFMMYIIIKKTAATHDSYTQVNRIHSRILLLYFLSMVIVAFSLDEANSGFLIGLATGIFIYASLHYVFVFALIGLSQKSISVQILVDCEAISTKGEDITAERLTALMQGQKSDINTLRDSRLRQMTHLRFATTDGRLYTITPFGRLVNRIGAAILKVYGLHRL